MTSIQVQVQVVTCATDIAAFAGERLLLLGDVIIGVAPPGPPNSRAEPSEPEALPFPADEEILLVLHDRGPSGLSGIYLGDAFGFPRGPEGMALRQQLGDRMKALRAQGLVHNHKKHWFTTTVGEAE